MSMTKPRRGRSVAEVAHGGLPFQEAIDFFRQKVNLPTEKSTDLMAGMHARAFVVAGAQTSELLADFRAAIDKAIANGTTLDTFKKDFDNIVATHGWSYKGSRGWRAKTIYQTNLRTAYAAGRYKQMTDPATLKRRPYWQYRHGDSANPRPEHLAWDGLVLPADDPWWSSHYPPNGWGCSCEAFALGERDLKTLGKEGPDAAPPGGDTNVDPEWRYNVGEAAWGRPLAENVMQSWRDAGADAFEKLSPGDAAGAGRPARVPVDDSPSLGGHVKDRAELERSIERELGDKERIFIVEQDGFKHAVNVNAAVLASHIDPSRAKYLPLLTELLEKPFEVWASFERHKGTGEVQLRYRFIRAFDTGEKEGMMLVAQAVKGQLEAWTFVPVSRLSYLNKQRTGKLVHGREEQ
jgi:hypothetical protein